MIIDLPSTTTQTISKRLVQLRNNTGAMTLGRVLTLIVQTDERNAEETLATASEATRQSPSRILALVRGNRRAAGRLDAQIRLGGDAGASEIIVLRLHGPLADQGRSVVIPLLLPDSPIVVWWPDNPPPDVAGSDLGQLASRRITDARTASQPARELKRRAETYRDGDTDMSWARITRWRGLLAAALDQEPYESVSEVTITGGTRSPSSDLLGAWLAQALKCPVTRARTREREGIRSVRLERPSGPIDLVRTEPNVLALSQPGQPVRRLALTPPSLSEVLAEELRRLDPDELYEAALLKGLRSSGQQVVRASDAVAAGEAPDVEEARRAERAAKRRAAKLTESAMVEEHPAEQASSKQVHKAARRKLDRKKAEQDTDAAAPKESGS